MPSCTLHGERWHGDQEIVAKHETMKTVINDSKKLLRFKTFETLHVNALI